MRVTKISRSVVAATVSALCLVSLDVTPAEAGQRRDSWLDKRFLHIAHQGGESEAPSNTIYAFRRAVRLGADVLEFDVHSTKDGILVANHDATVDRTTNGTGLISEKTYRELRALDAAYNFVPGRNAVPGLPP